MTAVAQALTGLKVLEFGGYAAGPHIGKLLANFGASSVHVESRERPDGFRIQYPPFKDNRPGYNRSGCFAFFNDSKYSVTVDLKKPQGVALAHRMAQWCDLIIENMRPGVMERLGFGYDSVHESHPGVIYLSCPAYPDGHRYAQRPGYDALVQASSGQMWEQPGWRMGPIFLHMPMPSMGAFFLVSSGVLSALIARERGKLRAEARLVGARPRLPHVASREHD